ncbi:MAG: xerC 2 [Devosia sp.]|uniref:hypothetical protein n=1 Tax=Devosia sp. TaxID=1871048 RepID=UPI00261CEFAC|nr:hypothetical protein [Devosia sp.]MDB5530210.1 xerC 2 [Devosia sp.]
MADITDHRPPLTITGTLASWADRLRDKSRSTVECYLRDIRFVADTMASTLGRQAVPQDLMDLGTHDLAALVACWRDAPSTCRRRLVSIRRYGLMLANTCGMTGPLLHAGFPRIDVRTEGPVLEADLLALAAPTGNRMDWTVLRDDAILTLVMERGLTTGELNLIDCRHLTGPLLLVRNPSGKARFVELSAKAAEGIDAYRSRCPYPVASEGALWLNTLGGRMSPRSLQLMIRRRRALAHLSPGVVAGSFRRHRIRSLAASGMPPDRIARQMGIGAGTVLVHLAAG